ncbi:uncharacterized protein VTP21DRAFT_3385 [Calcarisporiella thermophila]|uniref:uncharacterized protein n=1 Tax=Calcarisporiella thermophila TaxID=911321 RepID=UPI003744340F
MVDELPDYYGILGVPEDATLDQIREAYKRKALQCHPDRHPTMSQEEATAEFQRLADAYFVLSDAARRRDYDRRFRRGRRSQNGWLSRSADPDRVFVDAFQDLLGEERSGRWFWTPVGAISGAAIGFIVGNVPGAIIGGYGGSKLGAVRDNKGMSVYEAFQQLTREQKSALLAALAAKILQ